MRSSTSSRAPRRWLNFFDVKLWFAVALPALGASFVEAAPKPVMVHYMPWFVAEPFSASWGFHWTMNHFDPNSFDTNGQREIASWYYPQIGPYDSADPTVLEYHVLLLKLGGLDGVIVDWYGMDNFNDYAINAQRTLDLFSWTRKAGLKFALCYEDQTIKQEIKGGFITTNQAISHAQQTMLYARSNFFADPSYLRWNNQPVLLNFGPQYFTASSNWVSIFSVLAPSNSPAFFTEDNRLAAGKGAFDWPPMWMSQSNHGILDAAQLDSYLTAFEQKSVYWPAFVSSAFPRFHDIYQQAGVMPSLGYLDDADGATFQTTLRRAMTNRSAVVQVVTWNDYGEGTIIEPTTQYQYRDLATLQNFRRAYLNSAYPGTTNDLGVAIRLYKARRQYPGNFTVTMELDRIFSNAVAGNLADAALQLSGVESQSPVIYNLTTNGGQLHFLVGGFLSANGAQIQSTTNAAFSNWDTVGEVATGSAAPSFTVPISSRGGPTFFKARNLP